MNRRPLAGDLLQVGRRLSSVGALLLLLTACASLPKHSVAAQVPPPAAAAAWYCSTTYPVQCELPPISAEPRFYRVQLGGEGISGYPLNITSPSNDECLLLQGPPWVIVNGSCSGSSSTAWANITGGTNTTAAMLVGTGASLGYTGSGVVDANEINGLTFPSLVSSDCLTNNGTVLSWGTCGSGGSTTFQVNGTGLASSTTVNFENSAATDGLTLTFTNPSAGIVQLGFTGTLNNSGLANSATTVNTETCTLGSTCTIPFDINSSALTSQAGLNFITSTTNSVGLTVTPSNPATNEAKWEITGSSYTGNAATATNLASYPTLCSGSQFSQGLSSGSNNCATPSGSGITLQTNGTNNSNQTALNIENGQGVQCSNPSSGNVQCATTAPERTVTSSPTVESTDMGGQIVANVSGGGTLTIPAISSSIFASGMTLSVVNYSTSPMAISTTPTVNSGGGCSTANGIPAGGTWQMLSNGTTIDCAQTISGDSWLNAASSGTSVTPICLPGMRLTVTTVTATGNLTVNAPTGCSEGQQVTLKITYTASITYTWNAAYHANSTNPGALPTSSGDSSGVDFFAFYDDAANSRFDYLADAPAF